MSQPATSTPTVLVALDSGERPSAFDLETLDAIRIAQGAGTITVRELPEGDRNRAWMIRLEVHYPDGRAVGMYLLRDHWRVQASAIGIALRYFRPEDAR